VAPTAPGGPSRVPLDPAFEYGALVLQGEATLDGVSLGVGAMLYLGRGRSQIALAPQRPTRLLILGGAPFGEAVVMWWNFVARSDEEIRAVREDYMAGRRFGEVVGFDGDPLEAPALPAGRLRPR
jgi:redox-sensitive bicupin YhaK (pirin superfamily)